MRRSLRGFTLIELLVVITIIGILATVVLISVSSARGSGNDTAVKSNLATLQVQSTLYYGIANTYGVTANINPGSCTAAGTMFADSNSIADTIKAAVTDATKAAKSGVLVCHSKTGAFLVAGKLANGNYWCVDSVGTAKEENAAPIANATACLP